MDQAPNTCVFCLAPRGKLIRVSVQFMRMVDSMGNEYGHVVFPTCPEHNHIPSIHDRRPGVKRDT